MLISVEIYQNYSVQQARVLLKAWSLILCIIGVFLLKSPSRSVAYQVRLFTFFEKLPLSYSSPPPPFCLQYLCVKYEPLPNKLNMKTNLVLRLITKDLKPLLFIPQQWFPWQLLQHMTSPAALLKNAPAEMATHPHIRQEKLGWAGLFLGDTGCRKLIIIIIIKGSHFDFFVPY